METTFDHLAKIAAMKRAIAQRPIHFEEWVARSEPMTGGEYIIAMSAWVAGAQAEKRKAALNELAELSQENGMGY